MKQQHERQAEQVARAAGVAPVTPRDDEYVHVSVTAIEARQVVGLRREEEGEPFTGWEIVALSEDAGTARFGYFSITELEQRRPEWLKALALPQGWSFRFDDETLVHCTSPEGKTLPIGIVADVRDP